MVAPINLFRVVIAPANFLLWGLLWLFPCSGCRDATPLPSSPLPHPITETYEGTGPIQIVATVGMVGDMVQAIGGEHVQVTVLCGPGVDPHLFKPTRDHVAQFLASDLIVYAGLHLEGKLNDLLLRLSHQRPIYAVAQGIDPKYLLPPDSSDHAPAKAGDVSSEIYNTADPHAWMDVAIWAEAGRGLADCLSRFDPQNAADYQANYLAYQRQLLALHEFGQQRLAKIKLEQRILVTSHDAFRYFGRAYNLRVEGVQGLSTESEAGLQRLNGLVDLLVAKRVPAVFVESSVSAKNMQALIEGVQARGHQISLGGELHADSLGPANTSASTYQGMMRHNFETIAAALEE
ncbi:MAG: zinc ABC transporter substrate-binding protein [Planctomycetaceae bacterium]|nr:zinc ABC transporter substrate-binding protein [Planctomycetaceae bacterium]